MSDVVFRRGDTVVVHKPNRNLTFPKWIKQMDYLDGVVCSITDMSRDGSSCYLDCDIRFAFQISWLEPYCYQNEEMISEDSIELLF